MASIQQALNQMLQSAQIGVGLYAHTPEGQKRAEIAGLKKDIPKLEKMREQQAEADIDTEAANKAYGKILSAEEKAHERLYALDPNRKNYKAMLDVAQGREEFEELLEQQYTKRVNTLEAQKSSMEMRKKLLAGESDAKITPKSKEVYYGI